MCVHTQVPIETHVSTRASPAPPSLQPHSPSRAWVGKAGHTAQEGPGVWDGEENGWLWPEWPGSRCLFPVPKPGQPLQSWVEGEGKGSARALQPALHLGMAGE